MTHVASPCVDDGWRAVLEQAEAALEEAVPARLTDASFSRRVSSLAWSVRRDPDRAAAIVLEALRRDSGPSSQLALASSFAEFETHGGLGPECELAAAAAFERLIENCDTTSHGTGIVVRLPVRRDRGEACAQIACARCERGLAQLRRSFDERLGLDAEPADYAEASTAYEALVFGSGAACPASLHVAQMAVHYAESAGDTTQRDAVEARLEARFPAHVTVLVSRDIVSRGGPPDPCRSGLEARGHRVN